MKMKGGGRLKSRRITDHPHPVFCTFDNVIRQSIPGGRHFNKKSAGRRTSAFLCILTGACKYTFDGRSFVAEAGDFLFLPKGGIYAMDVFEEYSYIFVNLDFTEDADYYPEAYKMRNPGVLQNLFFRLLKAYNARSPEYREECMSLIYAIYACLQREKNLPYLPSSSRDSIERAAEFIRASYTRPELSVTDAASIAGMSVAHFRRLFRAVYSVCPSDYITELRITNAKELLSVGTMPAGEIAEKCGFASQYYFSRIFRKKTGVTPSEYRNRYSEAVVT